MNKVRLYRWQALDTQGQIRDGEMIATAKDAVFQHLFQEGLQPLSVRFNQRLTASYWRTDDLIVLFRQLATLLQAGLPLVNALTLLASEQTLLLAVPLISRLICGGCLTQIFQTLAMTQQAGLNLITGLQAAALSINNRCFRQAINEIQHQVTQGIPLHQALAKQHLFPPLCQQLIRIGEESGALDTLLARLAHWNEQQTYQLAEGLAQTLEPIMMLIVGGLVGGLVIAMYLPIFQLGSVMG
ncbi:type II secretion system F family protein [Edaphovirga cremea]|uniref:type II secretion system F family protein n=1 Tax=Edaphovirga cremea TaxID=2267246 RepID=UPI00398A2F52